MNKNGWAYALAAKLSGEFSDGCEKNAERIEQAADQLMQKHNIMPYEAVAAIEHSLDRAKKEQHDGSLGLLPIALDVEAQKILSIGLPTVDKIADTLVKTPTSWGDSKLSTGIPSIDFFLDGGFPCGRMAEIYGKRASGKTSLALSTAAEALRNDIDVAIIDVNDNLNMQHLEVLGIDQKQIKLVKVTTFEELIEQLCSTVEQYGLVIVNGFPISEEVHGHEEWIKYLCEVEFAMGHINHTIRFTGTTVIFVDQMTTKSELLLGPFGTNKDKIFAASTDLRLCASRSQQTDLGFSVRLDIKAKTGLQPGTQMRSGFEIRGDGISKIGSLLESAVCCGVIQELPDGLSMGAIKLGTRKQAIHKMLFNQMVLMTIHHAVKDHYRHCWHEEEQVEVRDVSEINLYH